MKANKGAIALAVVGLVNPLPLLAQSLTLEAESMMLSSYVAEGGNRIKLNASTGTATRSFSGASGKYNIKVNVIAESDGQPTLELHKGSTRLQTYTYPRTATNTSFTVSDVALAKGETIKLVGRANGDAWARVDSIVFTPVSTTLTIEAEGMALSSYAVEGGNRIKLTASSGNASKTFTGASGTYSMQVHVIAESDGQPTLEVHKGSTRLHTYTYPRTATNTSFTVSNVALNSGDTIRLVGRSNGDAWARVDKIVLTPVALAPEPATPPPPDTTACANPPGGYEGFGKSTTGGAGKPIYRVTNRNDSGAGSLRDALAQGNRCVVFDVGGTIDLSSNLLVRGANVTIDGLSAPSPGITLRNATLIMQGSSGASNVVVRGIRHRYAPSGKDAMRVYRASNIVFDRVSVSGFGDGGIDVTESSRDITIQWSILGAGIASHNFITLIAYDAQRVSVLNNLYIDGDDRNPYCGRSDAATAVMAEVVCDVRNNLIWNYKYYGTALRAYGTANVVNNYYATTRGTADKTVWNDGTAHAYVSGNHSGNGWPINGTTRSTPYAAVAPAAKDALTAAKEVVVKAGARGPKFGLDATDQALLDSVTLE